MGDRTGIAWANATRNPIIGCARVVPSAPDAPLHWRRPRRIFVNSMGDLFHKDVPDAWIDDVFAVMALAPQHRFILLTKRPERMGEYCQGRDWCDAYNRAHDAYVHRLSGPLAHSGEIVSPLPNVILGTSAEDQSTLAERVPHLLRTPAACRVVSLEPLLGPVDMTRCHPYQSNWAGTGFYQAFVGLCYHQTKRDEVMALRSTPAGVGWVIVGCESGPQRRPCPLEWVRSVVEQCAQAGVPCFVKQLDLGKRVSRNPDEWPEDLRVRQYPEVSIARS